MIKRSHALHNYNVCQHLHLEATDTDCNDWIVTTSFYSAIHFIDYAIFPCTYNGRTFNNVSEAHRFINAGSLHASRGVLVNTLIPSIRADYEFLRDNCHRARYHDYQVLEQIADRSVRLLSQIKNRFDKEKNQIQLS